MKVSGADHGEAVSLAVVLFFLLNGIIYYSTRRSFHVGGTSGFSKGLFMLLISILSCARV